MSTSWTKICSLEDIPTLGARRVKRAQGPDVAVFRAADDKVFALLDRCPHKGGPLSQGLVFGHSVACPLHSWTIALESGQAAAPDEGCAARFDVHLEDGVIYLDPQQLATVGLNFAPLQAGPCTRAA
ncbi:nitrite reductase small subunit NirD [Roseateles koreensis]|uniref:Nitrite reductase small subunit NirD n=1 Tax=Roseateles koreensis TaxID=2987526 RepID=A0ABT5KW39_9BURK|nr:nitrite reductase small subunit NirD [Roseateles koreensis]MDC8786635.1 nitrite reductase small subunit NirD [Roseateles koreensis]